MLLLTILLIIVAILSILTVLVIGAVGAAGIVIFGDVIVCILVLVWIIKRIIKKRKN